MQFLVTHGCFPKRPTIFEIYVRIGAFWYQICRGSKKACGLTAGKFRKFGLKVLFVSFAFIVPVTEASVDHESTNEQDFHGCSHDINQCSLIGNQQVRLKYLKPKHFRLISFKDLRNQSFK